MSFPHAVASRSRDPAPWPFFPGNAMARMCAIGPRENTMLLRDRLGNEFSGATAAGVEHFEHGLRLLQCYVGDPVSIADAAIAEAPDMVMAHVLRAWLPFYPRKHRAADCPHSRTRRRPPPATP